MQASKFLAMGKTQFYVVVTHGYAVHYELDGSMALFETSSLADGVYNQDYELADEEITSFYSHLINEDVPHIGKSTKVLTAGILRVIENTDSTTLVDVPKLTKALAENLTKNVEPMTFYIGPDGDTTFLCFGIRLPIVNFLENEDVFAFTCSSLNFYYATNYKGDIYNIIVPSAEMLAVFNTDKTCGGILFSIDMVQFDKYRKETQTDS